jgi:hypothetical protein
VKCPFEEVLENSILEVVGYSFEDALGKLIQMVEYTFKEALEYSILVVVGLSLEVVVLAYSILGEMEYSLMVIILTQKNEVLP